MRTFFLITCFALTGLAANAHPGTGIVKDSKGFIYYTDLANVYRIDPATKQKTIVVPSVHTHELFMDKSDNLYGENLWFSDGGTNRFDHYLWRLNSNGKLDTISGPSQAYKDFDFSVIRDNDGNEYRVQALSVDHILKKTKDGKVTTIANGSFKDLAWLQPFDDGTVYFSQKNALYLVTAKDSIVKVAEHISSNTSDLGIYGIWRKQTDPAIYLAVAGDGMVKKVNPDGSIENVFSEKDNNWFPTGGVFDDAGKLWVLEYSHKSDVRVIDPETDTAMLPETKRSQLKTFLWIMNGLILLIVSVLTLRYYRYRKENKRLN